ncbi:TPA: hypothetical protein QIZ59_003228 [Escherichia coli]|nr:hypothetical protein [Escherichia coli]HDV9184307.1 hypothetical protein [Escherichia coli]
MLTTSVFESSSPPLASKAPSAPPPTAAPASHPHGKAVVWPTISRYGAMLSIAVV